jgi:Rrf2 family protein
MKLLTKNTDYAIRALLELGKNDGQFISARDISSRQGIPYQYLRKLLQLLIKEGMVVSREGTSGGFAISRSPRRIKIEDVIRTFQGDIQLSECLFRKKFCPNRATCVLREQILEIEKTVARKFATLTIGKLIKKLS